MSISAGVEELVINVSILVPVPGPQPQSGGPEDLFRVNDPETFCEGELT